MRILFLLLFTQQLFAQQCNIRAVVVSAATRLPLPFASVGILNTTKGVCTNEAGFFELLLSENDILRVSMVGYKVFEQQGCDVADSIFLEEEALALEELAIYAQQKKRTRKVQIGTTKEKAAIDFGGRNQYACFLANTRGEVGQLSQVYYRVRPNVYKDKRAKILVRIRVYRVAAGLPGNDLLTEDVTMTIAENEKLISADISAFDVPFPIEGVFIGIDLLGYEEEGKGKVPYSKGSTPLHLTFPAHHVEKSNTYTKFFGMDWQIAQTQKIDGQKIPLEVQFAGEVWY